MSTRAISKTKSTLVPRRQRLAPEERAEQILDFAGQLIIEGGLTEISMERLSRDAGVSKALIYNYFPNLTDLLRALLEREITVLRDKGINLIAESTDFRDMIRRTTHMYIEHIAQRGSLLQRLWQEPTVARAVADKNQRSQNEATRYFVKQVRKEYDLPLEVAVAAVNMHQATTEAAAQHLADFGNNVDFVSEICVTLLMGGFEALAQANREKQEKNARAKVTEIKKVKQASSAKTKKPTKPASRA